MVNCAAKNCKEVKKKGTKLSFFKFPLNNPNLMTKWIAISQSKSVSIHAVLCEKHFDPQHVIHTGKRKFLTEDAKPIPVSG